MLLWLLAVFSPLLAAGLIWLFPGNCRRGKWLLVLASLPALGVASCADLDLACNLNGFLLGTRLGFGFYERTFILPTALAWTLSALFMACGRNAGPSPGFLSMFALSMGGNLGLVAAQDVVSFYTFFALMTFAAYALVIQARTPKALRAGRIYLFMAVCAEGLLIAGFMLAVFHSPSHYFVDVVPTMAGLPSAHPVFWLVFAGFGVKAGIMGLHFWLPLAHPVAPTPASAVLSGAMIKAGLLGWLHFFPLGIISFPGWGAGFMILGVGSTVYGVLAGLGEDSPKTVLAYSSISQMGLMSFTLGLGLYDQSVWAAARAGLEWLVINHALAKTTLFLGTAVASASLAGRIRRRLILIGLCLPGLALTGAWLTAGEQAKYLLKKAAQAGPGGDLSAGLLLISSILTTVLIAHFLHTTRLLPAKENISGSQAGVWAGGLVLVAGLPWCLPLLLSPQAAWGLPSPSVSALLPVVLGGSLYLVAGKPLSAWMRRAGDLMPSPAAGLDAVWLHGRDLVRQGSLIQAKWLELNFFAYLDRAISSDFGWDAMRHMEYRAAQWPVFGFWFMLVFAVLAGWALLKIV